MAVFDHWHPVYFSRDLKSKPVGIVLAGQPVCLFRTASGTIAAIDDACPHRRLKLSVGTVVGDRIRCQYHGWTFDACGEGESPGTPKLHTCTTSYDVREEFGAIWIKSRRTAADFPSIDADQFYPIGTFRHTVPAPLELTVDNFTEIEHSGTVHETFGYDLDRMHEVTVRFEATPASVRVVNSGPTKRLNPILRTLLGIRTDDIFHDDWTTYFSPVYSVYDHWWTSPDGTREAMIRWRLYMFFWPITDSTTAVTSFVYAKSRYPGPAGGLRIAKPLFRRAIHREIQADIAMLHHLADYDTGIAGLKLSRFDKVLGLTRERIARIYRGDTRNRIRLAG
jgi:phenylpropionate dioxygenase-like ring-hydroxylating dioxygenase large terminal subunit